MAIRFVTNAAVGNDKNLAVPANARWIVLHGMVTLTSTATAGNRQLTGQIRDVGNNVLFEVRAGLVQAASVVRRWAIAGVPLRDSTFIGDLAQVPLPVPCIVPPGGNLRLYDVTAVDALDTLAYQFMVDESIYEGGKVLY